MALRLYEIADEYKRLLDNLADPETGEINGVVANQLRELEKPLEDKCINTVRALKGWEAEYKAIKKERQAMQEREKRLKKSIDFIKHYLIENMEKTEIKEISCPQFEIKLHKNKCSVDRENLDISLLPQKYIKVTKEPIIDLINKDLSLGIHIPGARLIQKNRVKLY